MRLFSEIKTLVRPGGRIVDLYGNKARLSIMNSASAIQMQRQSNGSGYILLAGCIILKCKSYGGSFGAFRGFSLTFPVKMLPDRM